MLEGHQEENKTTAGRWKLRPEKRAVLLICLFLRIGIVFGYKRSEARVDLSPLLATVKKEQ
jgi:hypothetical protein